MTQPDIYGAHLDDIVEQEVAFELQTRDERHARAAVDAAFARLADDLEHVARRFSILANQTDVSPIERGEWAQHEIRGLQSHLTMTPMTRAIQTWEATNQELERVSAALEALLEGANAL